MEDFIGLRFLSSLLGATIDSAVLLAFLVVVLIAFLSPVVGYEPRRPLGISASVGLLIAYMVAAGMQYIFLWSGFYNQVGVNSTRSGSELNTSVSYFVFSVVKMVLFVAAMITLACGVLSLRVRKPIPKSESVAAKSENE